MDLSADDIPLAPRFHDRRSARDEAARIEAISKDPNHPEFLHITAAKDQFRQDLERFAKESVNFRTNAPSTQSTQDRVLRMYQAHVRDMLPAERRPDKDDQDPDLYFPRPVGSHEMSNAETYYDTTRSARYNMTAIGTGADTVHLTERREKHLMATRLTKEQIEKNGQLLNHLVDRQRDAHPRYHDLTPGERSRVDRQFRRHAVRSLAEVAQNRAALQDVRVNDVDVDMERLNAGQSRFMERVMKRISHDRQEAQNNEEPQDQLDDLDLEHDFQEPEVELEDDAEDQFADHILNGQDVSTHAEEIGAANGGDAGIPSYKTVATAFMKELLAVGNDDSETGDLDTPVDQTGLRGGTKRSRAATQRCQACVDDDTIRDPEKKERKWKDYALKRHLEGQTHSPYQQFIRRSQNRAQDDGYHGLLCELCLAIAPPDVEVPSIASIGNMTHHLERSDAHKIWFETLVQKWTADLPKEALENLAQEHERLKKELGWYEPGFKGEAQHKENLSNLLAKRQRRQLDLNTSA